MTTTTLLDLRALPAPEPMERVLDTLDRLHGYAELQVLLAREPHPLYPILARMGYAWRTDWQPDGACLVAIARTA
jgi:uncharacterized protein (DUF2249 family)